MEIKDIENTKFLAELREKFTDSQIEDFLKILGDTCQSCYDGDGNCQCWNDE